MTAQEAGDSPEGSKIGTVTVALTILAPTLPFVSSTSPPTGNNTMTSTLWPRGQLATVINEVP